MPQSTRCALSPMEALSANLTLITAHSGCEGTPPNSREHILRAIECGVEMIEIDVRREGALLYLSHDVPPRAADCVSLEECFSLIMPHENMMINCDAKNADLVEPIMCLAKRLGIAHRIVFTGECNHAGEQIHAHGASLWYSLWMSDDPDADIDSAREIARLSGCPALNMDKKMATARQHAQLSAAGVALSVWTVDHEEDLRTFLRMGVFNITTRNPSLALKLRDEIQGQYDAKRLPLEKIAEVVKSAGKLLLASPGPGEISTKEGNANYVTQRDIETEQYLITALSGLMPDAIFIGEESESKPIPKDGVCFIIDPIDGTTNFVHDLKCSMISVGVLLDGCPFLGVVYNPYADELFTALRSAGAYLNGRRIHVSTRHGQDALISIGTAPYYKETNLDAVIALIGGALAYAGDIRRSGTAAADFCNVACGRTEGFFEMRLSPWDYAAGALIVREAGGVVSDMKGRLLKFDSPSAVMCANRAIYPHLLALCNVEGA